SQLLVAFIGVRTAADFSQVQNISGVLLRPDLSIAADGLSFAGLPAGELAPQVVWNGRDYLVSWIDTRDPGFDQATTRAVRITEGGVVRDADSIQITPDDSRGTGVLASNGDGPSFLAWTTLAGQALFRRIGVGGGLGPLRSATETPGAFVDGLAGNGEDFLMAFGAADADFAMSLSARFL